jgi:hypothetical protein
MKIENERRLIDVNVALAGIETFMQCYAEKEKELTPFCVKVAIQALEMVRQFIKETPTVDAVEVVRCEKCRYYFDGACANYKNRVATRVPDFGDNYKYVEELKVAKGHFCSFGERKNRWLNT